MTDPAPRPTLSDRYWRLPWLARIGLVIVGVVGALVVVAQFRDSQPAARPAASSPAQTPAVTAGQIGPGEWLVGVDVQPGTYRVEVLLVRSRRVVAVEQLGFVVGRTGSAARIAEVARGQPVLYALVCIILAAFAGWLGSVVFRRN